MSILTTTAAGNIGRDAETRTTQKGTQVASFPLAVEVHQGGGERATQWVDCALFGDRAAKLAPYLTKGSKVTVIGQPSARAYTDKSGNQQAALKLMVNEVALQGGGSSSGSGGQGGAPGAAQAAPGDDGDDIPFSPIDI